MSFYTENIALDSFSGALFAVEGIKDACVILNGPTGCKFYHSAISDSQFTRQAVYSPLEYSEGFFGQPRIPATYLDGHDYIFGSGEKLRKILKLALGRKYAIIAVINSPGAALIGDDLEKFIAGETRGTADHGADVLCLALEDTGFSGSYGSGYQTAMLKVLEVLDFETGGKKRDSGESAAESPKVNLIGLSIYQKYFDSNYKAIKEMLECCGIETICAPGAGDSAAAMKNIPRADLNVVVYPEYGKEIAEYLESRFATPYIVPEEGPPIGFFSTAAFVKQICDFFSLSALNAEAVIEAARAGAYLYLSRISSLLGVPRGCLFSVKADSSTAYTLTRWLCSYLGMIPAAVSVLPGADAVFTKKLADFLAAANHGDAVTNPIIETPAQIVLADANTIAEMRLYGQNICGIEIALPSMGYIDVMEKTLFGAQGSLFLLEQILNGIRYVMRT
jgi:nitrogenase molybdenum-iron protein alpha/beta subunit